MDLETMNKKPLISIVTVSYNSEETIRKTIESVLYQSYAHIEYIIIDGKSTDSTVDIIRSYETAFSEKGIVYRWVSEPDEGIYDAMNKGVAMCSGDIVGIINSDDWYDKQAFDKVIEAYQKNPTTDIFYADLVFVGANSERVLKPGNLESLKYEMRIFHPSTFVRREVYTKQGNFNTDYKLAADYDFLLRGYRKGLFFTYIQYPLAFYWHGGMTSLHIKKSWRELKQISQNHGASVLKSNILYYAKVIYRSMLSVLGRV